MNGMMKAAIWIGGLLVGSSSGAVMFFAGRPSSMPPKPTPARDEAVKPPSKSAFTISDKGAAASQAVHPSQTAIPVKEPDVNSKFNAEVFDPPSNCRTGPGSGNAVKEVLQRGDVLVDYNSPQTDTKGEAWYREQHLGCWLHHSQVRSLAMDDEGDAPERLASKPGAVENSPPARNDAPSPKPSPKPLLSQPGFVGAFTEEELNEALGYIAQDDREALLTMMKQNRAFSIPAGREMRQEKCLGFICSKVKVRFVGTTESFYTVQEATR
jgi:hypothetical protein